MLLLDHQPEPYWEDVVDIKKEERKRDWSGLAPHQPGAFLEKGNLLTPHPPQFDRSLG